jgi:hypothetical protein
MKWAFIYRLDEPANEPRIDTIGSLVCVGVPSLIEAPAVAQRLIEQGVELIELCGGFGGAGLGAIVEAVGDRVPVGAVFYGIEASAGLKRVLDLEQD